MPRIATALLASVAVIVLGGRGLAQERPTMGDALMQEDGTIIIRMRRTADGKNISGSKSYPVGDPHYKEVLDHLGGMKPGEVKLVPAWPEPAQKCQ